MWEVWDIDSAKSLTGVCCECSAESNDFSLQKVCNCELCHKLFCEKHAEPRLPQFADWDVVHGFPGTTELKILYYTERNLNGGHPDVAYLRKKLNAFEIEEDLRIKVVECLIGRIANPEKYLGSIAVGVSAGRIVNSSFVAENSFRGQSAENFNEVVFAYNEVMTKTFGNIYHHKFEVPSKIYSLETYGNRMNNARTLEEIDLIIKDYQKQLSRKS